ncbi:Oidioi.mRNA.OKI2018_I69.chr1.g2671.t1.cds [Oikopleura dioica]|uniref:Oidioi.mRNA.OKI2018_I69.chr1.g2671.t1.cds n=1 Tax=Oikopleura dioica TaxID=34765 RepID=A0ABN7SRU0_OIKDI|nr:Oidioi.mRNA.OKI2018_I69.chr1.g2671.t1.cds [Oikopleura dioica]
MKTRRFIVQDTLSKKICTRQLLKSLNSTLPPGKPSAQKTSNPNPQKRTSPRQASTRNPSPLAQSTPKINVKQEIMAEEPVVRSRSIFGIDDMKVLTKNYAKNQCPSAKKIDKIAKKLDKTPTQIKNWFARRRSGSIKSLPSEPITTRFKREREESPVKTEAPDDYCEQRTKRACRRSPIILRDDSGSEDDIDTPLEVVEEEQDSPDKKTLKYTVENISPNDAGFYLDRQASNELFSQIWKIENKLPLKALEYLSMRSGRTVSAVRTWFHQKTKKEKATNSIIKPTQTIKINEKVIKQAESLRSATSDFATVRNISPNDNGFYLNHAATKNFFYEIWKTEPEPPIETLRFLAMRSEKSVPAVRLHFQRLTKQHKWEQYKMNNVRIYMPADKCYKVIQIGGEEFNESSDHEDESPHSNPPSQTIESDKENEKESTPSEAAITTLPKSQERTLPDEKTTDSQIEEGEPSIAEKFRDSTKLHEESPVSVDHSFAISKIIEKALTEQPKTAKNDDLSVLEILELSSSDDEAKSPIEVFSENENSLEAKKDDSTEELSDPTDAEAAKPECDGEKDNLPLENPEQNDVEPSSTSTDSKKPDAALEKTLPKVDNATAEEESDDEYEIITTQHTALPICHKYASSVLKDGQVIIPHDSPILIQLYERSSVEDLL